MGTTTKKKTTTELEIKVSGGRISEAKLMPNGTCKLTIEMINIVEANTNDVFVLIDASKLSIDDEFLQHEPQTDKQIKFKTFLIEAIKTGKLQDFYHPKYDPSLDDNGNICYIVGGKPAIKKQYEWWDEKAKLFMPERNSRLGTKNEYIAFLGVLIKKLVKGGWNVADAWKAVCDDSKQLGHYKNSNDSKNQLECTGSRQVAGLYDLANTCKILGKDKRGNFLLASSDYCDSSEIYPLADIFTANVSYDKINSVGWIVLF